MKWNEFLQTRVSWRGMNTEAAVHASMIAASFALVAALIGAWQESISSAVVLWVVSQALLGIAAFLLFAQWRFKPNPHPDDAGHRGFAIGLAFIVEMLAIAVVVSIAFFR